MLTKKYFFANASRPRSVSYLKDSFRQFQRELIYMRKLVKLGKLVLLT